MRLGLVRVAGAKELAEQPAGLCLERPLFEADYFFQHGLRAGNHLVASAGDGTGLAHVQPSVEQVVRDESGVDRGSVGRPQRTMALQRVDRLVEPAEVERRVAKSEQDRAAQPDRASRKCKAFGTPQRAIGAGNVAAGVHRLSGVNHRRPGNRQRIFGRLRNRYRSFDLSPGGIERAAQPVQVAQVLARHDLAGRFTRLDEPLGSQLVERDALCLVLFDGGVGQY